MITATMRKRGRLVTLTEAREATRRLINSHFSNKDAATTSIPANVNDDDLVATDYLHQQTMSDEDKVFFLRPGARVVVGHAGKVWIADDSGLLGDISVTGTRTERELNAWASALWYLQLLAGRA